MQEVKVRPAEMRYTNVNINKCNNGYIVTTVLVVGQQAEKEEYVFTDFDAVLSFLKPASLLKVM